MKSLNDKLLLLPGDCTDIVVQYEPYLSISCVVPAQQREITVTTNETEKYKVKTPPLLLCQDYDTKTWKPTKSCLYAIKTDKSKGLWLSPFRMANVHTNGVICWGDNDDPSNLRKANSEFWQAPFNMDLWSKFRDHEELDECPTVKHKHVCKKKGQGHQHTCIAPTLFCHCCQKYCDCCKCCSGSCDCSCRCELNKKFLKYLKNYQPGKKYQHDELGWEDRQDEIFGTSFVVSSQHQDAVFVSTDKETFKELESQEHIRKFNNKKLIIGFGIRKADGWVVTVEGQPLPAGIELRI